MSDTKPTYVSEAALMTLSHTDMQKAVEYWLNNKVMRYPCRVTDMKEVKAPTYENQYSTFEIVIGIEEAGDEYGHKD